MRFLGSPLVASAASKKRLVGLFCFAIIFGLFFSFNRFPKLDIVGEDLEKVTGTEIQCFQGFCIENQSQRSLVARWVSFSVTYLRLVTMGMTFAFLVAGLAEAFLFPPESRNQGPPGTGPRWILRGAVTGQVMNLCSACVVPVSSAFYKRAGLAGAIAMVQGSATMNVPALVMAFSVFNPLLGFSRLLMAILGSLLVGPIVAMTVRKQKAPDLAIPDLVPVPESALQPSPWKPVLAEGFRDWARATIGYFVRLGPIMVLAGFASGFVIQWLSPSVVSEYLGNDLRGVLIAATFGVLINVPLLFEIPLVALLLVLGMGTAPAATLLFTAAAGGPITFWGLARIMPRRAIATFAGTTWALGALGGIFVLGIGSLVWENASTELTIQKRQQPAPAPRITLDLTNLPPGAVYYDSNLDGLDDVYVPSPDGSYILYGNNGDGTYTDVTGER